jgi:preprotein translocase SecF subunit
MFQIVERRRLYYIFSALLILIGLVAMGYSVATYPERAPVRLSIDFVGGSLFEFGFLPLQGTSQGTITETTLEKVFAAQGLTDLRIQRVAELNNPTSNRWQVRSTKFTGDAAVVEQLSNQLNEAVKPLGFELNRGAFSVSEVLASVGAEVGRAAIIALIIGSLIVTGFIVFAFRTVPNALRYGICAIIAMIHDVLILVGVMSLAGILLGWEADSLFVTALLTVVAYSVQDSIVVFDRIRENVARRRGEPYEMIVNRSIMETVQRSITTQLLVGFILLSLLILGGTSIRPFVGVLMAGLISGTYSSLFVAIPLLVSWEKGELPFVGRQAA